MTRRTSAFVLALVVSVLGPPPVPASAEDSHQEAVDKYQKGRALIEKQKYEAALKELSASYSLLDSPNTLLLMAHAERELGRNRQAATLYERVLNDAKERASSGETRFHQTAVDAQEWLAKLSERLGKISVTVSHASEGATLTIGGTQVKPTRSSGSTLLFDSMWWPAGAVRVEATTMDGGSRSIISVIPSGGSASVEFDLADKVAPTKIPPKSAIPQPPTKETERPEGKSIPAASWIAGGIGVAGLAAFALFGSMAKSKASDLDACSPRCAPSDRDSADAGKRDQTIANVGLVAGGVGLVAAVGFYLFQPSSDPASGSIAVRVTPDAVLIRGSFH